MAEKQRTYIAIDLKSFYASVECVQRGFDPLKTNLVVADESRTEKTICLAVSPSLKALGISGRARLFEVVQRVKEVNAARKGHAPGRQLTGSSVFADELQADSNLEVDFVIAPPQMAKYTALSAAIYQIYLQYISEEDMHAYSVDEVFMDVTDYLPALHMTPRELAMHMIHEVLSQTGITATAGIGTNLYLCKAAMDIVAKHIPADADGVRIAEIDVLRYRQLLWEHRPLTDFWRVGRGYARKLERIGLQTMGDIAEYSMTQAGRDHLFQLFGINAELLIDHAWGYEPTTMRDVKLYGGHRKSLGSGQVLACPYTADKARIVLQEMADALSMDLFSKKLCTEQLVLTVGYDIDNLTDPNRRRQYTGPVTTDMYGRRIPKHAHGTTHLGRQTASTSLITRAAVSLYDSIISPDLLVRRLYLTAEKIVPASSAESAPETPSFEQLDLFTDYEALEKQRSEENERLEKEKRRQEAVLAIQKKFGKNAILKGTSLLEGATQKTRNGQIGGHKA